jgi:Leucine-rich repeat (LRR) protein
MPKLKILRLRDFNLRPGALGDLSTLQNLEDLSISGAALDAEAFEQLRQLPKLAILRLNYNSLIPGVDEKPKLTGLEKLTGLKRININGRNIDVSHLHVIGELENLEALNIGNDTIINDDAAQHLTNLRSLASL